MFAFVSTRDTRNRSSDEFGMSRFSVREQEKKAEPPLLTQTKPLPEPVNKTGRYTFLTLRIQIVAEPGGSENHFGEP
ncbi:hypothetical protein J6590_074153 [Homalodisca vitripennis]|nr:hypothetical protein J6590_074153 [Homalodisca vitripennis]